MWYLLSFSLACLLAQPLPLSSHLPWELLGVGVLSLGGSFLGRHWRRSLLLRFITAICFGASWGAWQTASLCRQQLPARFDNSQWQLTALVTQMGGGQDSSRSFKVQVLAVDCQQDCPPLKDHTLALSWYKAPALNPGDIWHFSVKLKGLQGFANPGGFDFQAYQLAQGVMASGSVKTGERQGQQPLNWLGRLRSSLLASFAATEQPVQYERFYRALAFGDTAALDWQDWQVLQRTGTVHLMAISGFQVGLMAWLGFMTGVWVARCLAIPRPRWGALALRLCPWLLSVAAASVYTALANFAVPAVRACVAVALLNSAWALGWRPSLYAILLWALVWVVITEPLVALNTGFWLSYLAVLALLLGLQGRLRPNRLWREVLEAQWVMSFALLIPLFVLHLPFSLSSPLANLLLAPAISLVATPGVFVALLVACVTGSTAVFFWLDTFYGYCWSALTWLATWPPNLWWPAKIFYWPEIALGCLGTLLLLAPRGLGLRPLSLVCWLACLWVPALPKAALEVTVLDVGQGLAVLAQTPHHTLLYDLGPAYSPQFDAGTGIVLPALIGAGRRRAELVISRDEVNHSGGWRGIFNALPCRFWVWGSPWLGNLQRRLVSAVSIGKWMRWR